MSTSEKGKFGGPKNTKVVHVGVELFKKLDDGAIDISHQSRRRITPSQVAQYLVVNYLDAAKEKLLKEIKSGEEK